MTDQNYKESQASEIKSSNTRKQVNMPIGKIVSAFLILFLCGASFAAGMAYQKNNTKVTVTGLMASTGGPFGQNARNQQGGIGQVSAISSSSITVTNQRSNAAKTYTIDSSTTVSSSGTAAHVSDIKSGDTVIIVPSTSDQTVAARIILNPTFGGGMMGAPDESSMQSL